MLTQSPFDQNQLTRERELQKYPSTLKQEENRDQTLRLQRGGDGTKLH